MDRKKIKRNFALLAIVATIVGWLLSHSSHYPFTRNLLTPRYSIAISALEEMNQEGFILREGDPGFSEISELFRDGIKTIIPAKKGGTISPELAHLRKLDKWKITQFKTLKSEIGMGPNDKATRRLTLQISSANAPVQELPVADMRSWIESKYKQQVLFCWGKYVFWAGVCIAVFSVFL